MARRTLVVSSFYRFFSMQTDEVAVRKLALEARAAKLGVCGLVILASEGCNGTISGEADDVESFEQALPVLFGDGDWMFKRAFAIHPPFQDFRIKVRPEIVTTRSPEVLQVSGTKNHLSPAEWQKMLESRRDAVLIDTRNQYETRLGKFKGAIDPEIDHFSEFGPSLEKLGISTEQPVMIYCTGGIRCEKAILEMERRGYNEVYQLEGGILRYLEEYPHRDFEGECFVFDGRVAVDQNLEPSKVWHLCPHCGDPAKNKISCHFCEKDTHICDRCSDLGRFDNRRGEMEGRLTCSQDCAYRLVNNHPRSKPREVSQPKKVVGF